jgi:hypothetical protein
MQLAVNIFIPEKKNSGVASSNIFKINCQKAMARYFTMVVNKTWKKGERFEIDKDWTMIIPTELSLVTQDDIGIQLDPKYVEAISKSLKDETISNLENFLTAFIDQLEKVLSDPNATQLTDNELIGDYQ